MGPFEPKVGHRESQIDELPPKPQSVCTTHHTIGKCILCGGPWNIALCSVACTLTTNLQSTTQTS